MPLKDANGKVGTVADSAALPSSIELSPELASANSVPSHHGAEFRLHPSAELFPAMSEEELAELADDIKLNGLREPVWVHQDGSIIDGRNRYLACERAGIVPNCKVYPGDDESILAFVVSRNLHRRHLTTAQKAAIAAELSNRKRGDTLKQGSEASREASGVSDAEAAKLMGVSEASVERAKALKRDAPDLHTKVKDGKMKPAEARREAEKRRPPEATQEPKEQSKAEMADGEKDKVDDTKFILEHLIAASKLLNYYKGQTPQRVAKLIEPAKHALASQKASRLGNWCMGLATELKSAK
jgi:ParB-like chromosome segregation protein Spo0J